MSKHKESDVEKAIRFHLDLLGYRAVRTDYNGSSQGVTVRLGVCVQRVEELIRRFAIRGRDATVLLAAGNLLTVEYGAMGARWDYDGQGGATKELESALDLLLPLVAEDIKDIERRWTRLLRDYDDGGQCSGWRHFRTRRFEVQIHLMPGAEFQDSGCDDEDCYRMITAWDKAPNLINGAISVSIAKLNSKGGPAGKHIGVSAAYGITGVKQGDSEYRAAVRDGVRDAVQEAREALRMVKAPRAVAAVAAADRPTAEPRAASCLHSMRLLRLASPDKTFEVDKRTFYLDVDVESETYTVRASQGRGRQLGSRFETKDYETAVEHYRRKTRNCKKGWFVTDEGRASKDELGQVLSQVNDARERRLSAPLRGGVCAMTPVLAFG